MVLFLRPSQYWCIYYLFNNSGEGENDIPYEIGAKFIQDTSSLKALENCCFPPWRNPTEVELEDIYGTMLSMIQTTTYMVSIIVFKVKSSHLLCADVCVSALFTKTSAKRTSAHCILLSLLLLK
jgi:hypothetical protein